MAYNILDVAKDFVKGELEYAGGQTELDRLDICGTCDAKVAGMCTACGCVIHLKVKMAKSECPMGLWGPVLTEGERSTLDD